MLDDVENLLPGLELRWAYNNMISRSRVAGWVIMRLDPTRPSIARLGAVEIEGQQVLTVTHTRLNFRVLLPRMRLRFTASEPLELELDRVESGRHLVYRAVREMIVVGGRRAPLYSFKDAVVQVTASQWLRLEDVSRTGERLSFRVVRDPAVRDAVGPIAWFAHSPMESDGFLPVGSVQFGASDSAAIDVDLTPFVNLRDREALHVEAVSLRDPRHLWAAAVTPTA